MKASFCALVALIGIVGCKPNEPPPPPIPEPFSSGEQLITAMHNRYAGRWTTALTTVFTHADTVRYLVLAAPDFARIDDDPLTAGNGLLIRGDTEFVMQRGNVISATPRLHSRVLLEFAVFHSPPARTIERLRQLGYDLSRIKLENWEGHEAYVVGTSPQFWVERSHLLLVRVTDRNGEDYRYGNYKEIGSMWVAPTVDVYKDGRLLYKEDRQHMRIDARIDTAMFTPATWSTALHWYNQR